jgi:hypothetical protein
MPLDEQLQGFREELLAAIAGVKLEVIAELRKELGGIRAEIGGLRKAVEIIAIKLLSEPEVEEVRRAATR